MNTRPLLPFFFFACLNAALGQQLPSNLQQKIDDAARQVLAKTGVPSAELGILQNGTIVYTTAYGNAILEPQRKATPQMHYAVGSISKQFTAACLLILQQQGKLKLDDPVGKWFPELSAASQVTVRNLLTHTSGYSDYAPQDYTIPEWTKPTTAQAIVHQWATKPLDFDPGTQWQYSNTNYNVAGLIVEKASGQPFWSFLSQHVLQPLALHNVLDLDRQRAQMEPVGYMRNAFGPLRPAIPEAPGWYFADGELAMPVADLLTWDLSILNQSLLSPESYKELTSEFHLKNGTGTGYGLGIQVGTTRGHRIFSHTGEIGGFVASNAIYPNDKIAIAVLTNQEASSAATAISRAVADLLFANASTGGTPSASTEATVKAVLSALQHGTLDRSMMSPNANFYFSAQAIADYRDSLSKLGDPSSFTLVGEEKRGGMIGRFYTVKWSNGTEATLSTYWLPDGKIEQFLIEPHS